MRRLLRVAARLYPGPWRARYGREFDLLLDEAGPSWGEFVNVLQGAIVMHVNSRSFASITVVCGLIGIATSTAIAFAIQDQYVSTSVVRIPSLARLPPEGRDGKPFFPSPAAREIWSGVQQTTEKIRNRRTLTELIQTFGLYPEARRLKPMEDVIEDMNRAITIRPLSKPGSRDALVIQYTSSDRGTAQAVTRELTKRFVTPSPVLSEFEVLDEANSPKFPV